MLVWVAWKFALVDSMFAGVAFWQAWRGWWHVNVGGVLACVVLVGWVVCLRRWRARVTGMLMFFLFIIEIVS